MSTKNPDGRFYAIPARHLLPLLLPILYAMAQHI